MRFRIEIMIYPTKILMPLLVFAHGGTFIFLWATLCGQATASSLAPGKRRALTSRGVHTGAALVQQARADVRHLHHLPGCHCLNLDPTCHAPNVAMHLIWCLLEILSLTPLFVNKVKINLSRSGRRGLQGSLSNFIECLIHFR